MTTPREQTNTYERDTTRQGQGSQHMTPEEQIRELKEMNARLLAILESQSKNGNNDDEGKFYKRLVAHKPRSYDGEANPVKFED